MQSLYKKLLVTIGLIGLIAASAVAQSQSTITTELIDDWQRFSSASGGFSVLMPGKPVASDEKVETAMGTLVNHTHSASARGVHYLVIHSEFPIVVTDGAMIKRMLDGARQEGLAAVKGELKDEKQLKIGAHAGREWLINVPRMGTVHARAYWVTRRLYQLLVVTKDSVDKPLHQTEVRKFFDSFTVVEQ